MTSPAYDTATARTTGRRLGIACVVSGGVRIDDAGIRVLAQIADAAEGEVVWSEGYDRPMEPRAIIRAQRDLAGEIAAVVGHPFGTVDKDIARRVDAGTAPAMTSYACALRAHVHRRDPAAVFRMHGGTDAISEALAAGLRRAERLAAGHALGSARMRCPGAPADEPADPRRDGRLSVDRAVRSGSSAQAGC